MATVNRYTQTVDNIYQPRTLQELMIAPAYKRQKHDEINSAISEYETGLSQASALDLHSDKLKEEQKRLYDKMIEQRDKLDSEGFSQSAKSNFMRFNKEYQSAIGPQGEIGKIQSAKQAMEAEKEKYISNATKAGYSPEQASKNWDSHSQSYAEEFAKNGKVSNIGALYAPKYHNVKTEMQELLKDAGYSLATLKNDLGSSTIIKGENDSYVLTRKAYEKYGDNASQIQAALDYMSEQINDTDSEVYQSITHQGKTKEDALNEIEGLKDVYFKSEHDFGSGNSISGYSQNKTEENLASQGLVFAGNTFSEDILNDSYVGIQETISELENKPPAKLTNEEKLQLNRNREFKRLMDEEISKNPEVQSLKNNLDAAKKEMEDAIGGSYKLKDYEKINLDATLSNPNIVAPNEVEAAWRGSLTQSKVEAYNQAVSEFENGTVGLKSDLKLLTNYYSTSPITSKQKTLDTNFNKVMTNVLTDSPQSLAQNTTIAMVTDEQGNTHSNFSPNDIDAISAIVANASMGDIEVKSFTPQSQTGLPGYKIRVKTKGSYKLDGWDFGDDTIGGEGEWVTLDLSFNKMDSPVIRDLNQFTIDYLGTVGMDGAMISNKMLSNRIRDDYRGQTWGDLRRTGEFKNDPRLMVVYQGDLEREAIRRGLDPNTLTEDEFNELNAVIEARGVEINY